MAIRVSERAVIRVLGAFRDYEAGMTADSASRDRQIAYERWLIRRAAIEECALLVEREGGITIGGHSKLAAIAEQIRALKERE